MTAKRDYSRIMWIAYAALVAWHFGALNLDWLPIVASGPIPKDQFRVLIVYESAEGAPLQISADVRTYLRTHTADNAGTPEWRLFDKDTDLENESDTWREIWKASQPFKVVPCVIAIRGTSGTVEPMPATAAELLALLKKYGGD